MSDKKNQSMKATFPKKSKRATSLRSQLHSQLVTLNLKGAMFQLLVAVITQLIILRVMNKRITRKNSPVGWTR